MSAVLLSNPRYLHFMNHADIQWPDGADDGRLVPEFHDLWWLSNLILCKLQACCSSTTLQDCFCYLFLRLVS